MAAQTVSLLATGLILWVTVIGRRLLFEPLPKLIGDALFYAALAWLWSAVITLILFLFLPRQDAGRMLRSVLRTSAVAIWFAPACILLSQLSAAALAAALALAVAATRLFYAEWTAGSPAPAPAPPPVRPGLFGEYADRQPLLTRELATGIAAAFALQFGVVSIWKHQPLMAGCWFVLSAAVITLFALVSGAVAEGPPPSLPRSALGILATILLGATLTVGGMRMARGHGVPGEGTPGSGIGAVASAREVLRDLFGDPDAPDAGKLGQGTAPVTPPLPQPNATGISFDGTFPGVILWPEERKVTRLVAPLPRGGGPGLAPARSYSIPFDGRYLLYQWPMNRPPATSVLERGTPAEFAFRTTNRAPLNMDAVQRFDDPVDLGCCSRVRVEIWNADRYPGTVTLELLADDTSLGTAPVNSRPDLDRDPIVAVPEPLDFRIPPGIRPVRELKVVFRRNRTRADKSARIAIDRFVLLP
jgi:hypothetical protein